MYLQLDSLTPDQVYFTLIQSLVPRPIAWVLTQNSNQSYNLAPFSFFNAVCSDPPLIMLSLGKKPNGSLKDTLINIEQNRCFTVHIAHRELLPALNQSSASLKYGESELDDLNLELCEFDQHPLPRIKCCRVAYACECYEIHSLGNTPQRIIYGKVNQCYFDDTVVTVSEQGRVKLHADRLDPIARLGANEYAGLGKIIQLARPK
jgi:flavin reductase (DIM6/NTAB) family NADH-FMN oxidoreductase RutF